MSRFIRLGSFAVLSLGLASVVGAAYQIQPFGESKATVVSGPEHWVPFEADLVVTDAQGKVTTTGRIYRSSDGSLRQDSFAPAAKSSHTVIFSIQKRMVFYLRPPTAPSWEAYPLQLPKAGYRPKRQVALSALKQGSKQTIAGFEAWEYARGGRTEDAQRVQVAPNLNFYPMGFADRQSTQTMTNVLLREPSRSVFAPPDGVNIIQRFEPKRLGIFTREEVLEFGAIR